MIDDTSMASNETNPLPQIIDDDTIDYKDNVSIDRHNVKIKSEYDIFKDAYVPAFLGSIQLMKIIMQVLMIILVIYLYMINK